MKEVNMAIQDQIKWNEKDDIYVNPEDKNEYFTVFGYENNNYLTFFGDNYFIALSKKS